MSQSRRTVGFIQLKILRGEPIYFLFLAFLRSREERPIALRACSHTTDLRAAAKENSFSNESSPLSIVFG